MKITSLSILVAIFSFAIFASMPSHAADGVSDGDQCPLGQEFRPYAGVDGSAYENAGECIPCQEGSLCSNTANKGDASAVNRRQPNQEEKPEVKCDQGKLSEMAGQCMTAQISIETTCKIDEMQKEEEKKSEDKTDDSGEKKQAGLCEANKKAAVQFRTFAVGQKKRAAKCDKDYETCNANCDVAVILEATKCSEKDLLVTAPSLTNETVRNCWTSKEKFHSDLAASEKLATTETEKSDACTNTTASGTGTDKKKSGDEGTSEAEGTSGKGSSGAVAKNSSKNKECKEDEDDDDDDDSSSRSSSRKHKKKSKCGGSAIGDMMSSLGQALAGGQGGGNSTPPTPQELPSDSCFRPENANSCICQPNRLGCADANTVPNAFTQPGNSEGGAQLVNNDEPLSLGADPFKFAAANQPHDSGGAAPAGAYVGGGGGGAPRANFTPDAPKGRGGSGLSAEILLSPKGSGGAGLIPRSAASTNRDPEKLPGYVLGKEPTEFQRFVPPTGSIPQPVPETSVFVKTTREVSSESIANHPASVNFFGAIQHRYKDLDSTFYP